MDSGCCAKDGSDGGFKNVTDIPLRLAGGQRDDQRQSRLRPTGIKGSNFVYPK